MWQEIKRLNEERGTVLKDMREILKKSQDEKRDLNADESKKFDELNGKSENLRTQCDRLEKAYAIEKDLAERNKTNPTPGRDNVENRDLKPGEAELIEIRSQFNRYLRGTPAYECRSLTVAGQGVVGTREFVKQLVMSMKAYTGVREAGADVIPTGNGNPLTIPTSDDTSNTGRLVAEAATNNNVTEPTLGTVTLGAYKFDSDWIKISIEMLRDNEYDLEGKISAIAGERLGRVFNTYSTTGSGSSQPTGFVVAGSVGKTLASPTAITYDELIDFIHSLDPAYRNQTNKCAWQLHDTTLAAVRKLKDGNGRYIWLPGEVGQPDKLLGYRYVVNNDMATIAAAAKIAAFGDWSRFTLRDVAAPELIRANELFIGDGLVGFKVFSRHDCNLTDTKAIKLLKTAIS